MSVPHALSGVLVAVGPARRSDLTTFTECGLRLARMRCQVNPVSDVPKWRDAGATDFVLQVLSPSPAQRAMTAASFVERQSEEIEAFLAAGVQYLEIHDEPNRTDRGLGVSWSDGVMFSAWFGEVVHCLHARFGYDLKVGFPALASTSMPYHASAVPVDEGVFLRQCSDTIEDADWVALHIYWRTQVEMRAYDGVMRFLRTHLEAYPNRDFIITEFANRDPQVTSQHRGSQYAEFLTLTAQYDRILGACGFLLRSNDPRYSELGWLEADGTPRDVVGELVSRPRFPDPRQIWFVWPTESRYYDQVFGEDQKRYYDDFGMVGGHNGVDLGVDDAAPEKSPIYAALDGTVTQVALDQDGYGYHVRVRSYGPAREEITLLYAHLASIEVSIGMLVPRGDLIGWAGSTGSTGSPHLHLGMRVDGLQIPAVSDWLNPRPYLEARPRGLPREPFVRTYVLLPPEADHRWASAVIEGGWAEHGLAFGGSADDAGIGALDLRRVVAVNPVSWQRDLGGFFEQYYPGVVYAPLVAESPETLRAELSALVPEPEYPSKFELSWPFGLPREPYARTYVLFSPNAGKAWALAAVQATWNQYRFTMGSSLDDAGIGDLDVRRVIAINPDQWDIDLGTFFRAHYPGVELVPVVAEVPGLLAEALAEALAERLGDA